MVDIWTIKVNFIYTGVLNPLKPGVQINIQLKSTGLKMYGLLVDTRR